MNRHLALSTPWSILYQSVSLYRANFGLFFRLALYSNGWFLASNLAWFTALAILLASPFALLIFLAHVSGGQGWLVLAIAVVFVIAMFGLSIFTSAKGLLRQALIGQIAYHTLIGQPEPVQVIFRRMRPRMWQFWLVEAAINATLACVGGITGKFEGGWILLGIALQIFVLAQRFLADFIIAVESCNAGPALRRSQEQCNSLLLPISGMLAIVWLFIVPLYLLAFLPAIAVWQLEWQTPETALFTRDSVVHLIQAIGISIVLCTLFQTLTIPFWQSIKASLYQTLRASHPSV
ncbi:MAG: hypothetical protein HC780_23175 [Leptolyngbyaceae cyanobacterium CSU_1_3]|nr:hypothetical protein [Leptolyngbyaceae cyanobacterium CSU_1_3]